MTRLMGSVSAAALVLAMALAACAPGAGPSASSTAPSAAAAASANARREVALVGSVRPIIVSTLDSMTRGDVAAAKKAWSAYDPAWNGIEVYVNFRSRDLYAQLETDLQGSIDKAFAASQTDVAATTKLVGSLLATYDEAIALSTTGPAISPLFDDIATIRMTRAPLRAVSPALKAGDLATANDRYAAFAKAYPDARPFLRRSTDAFAEIEAAKGKVDAALPAAAATSPELAAQVDAFVERYNYGLGLVNAAARAADLARTAFSSSDVTTAVGLALIEAELRSSLALRDAADTASAGAHATRAAGPRLDGVAPVLKEKGADVNLRRALDAYAGIAGQAGDAAKARAADKTAIEAVWVAEQGLVGQFWSDPELHGAIVRGLAGALTAEYAAPGAAGYRTAWGILGVIERRSAAASLGDRIAGPLVTLRAALPDPAKRPAAPAGADAIAAAATALGSALP